MKQLVIASIAAVFMVSSVYAVETRKECVKQTDPKTKKEKEVCKTIKIHKKLEGTKVPEKK